jgi:hypothetical protein
VQPATAPPANCIGVGLLDLGVGVLELGVGLVLLLNKLRCHLCHKRDRGETLFRTLSEKLSETLFRT